MTRLAVLLALPGLTVGLLWPALWPLAILVTLLSALVIGAVLGRPTRSATPQSITRLPTRYEQRRWGYGVGIAVGFHGAFPFVYLRRRIR